MKISDVTPDTGLYVGVRYDAESVEKVKAYQHKNNIPNPLDTRDFHSTVIHSKTADDQYECAGELSDKWEATPAKCEKWKTRSLDDNGNPIHCLVMKLESADLANRHKELMESLDLTYDFDEYKPHITLSYEVPASFDMDTLGDCADIGTLYVSKEYFEELQDGKFSKALSSSTK